MGLHSDNEAAEHVLISVVLPAYNAERCISASIRSVLRQTYRHFELLIVNDGSSDSTSLICQKFAAQDDRIVLVSKERNEGVDRARYDGVKRAKGAWITFLDADDLLMPEALDCLYGSASQYHVDVVMGCSRLSALYGLLKRDCLLPNDILHRTYNHEVLMEKFYISFFGVNILPVTMWGKLYKTEILRQSYQPTNLKFGEDLLVNMRVFPLLSSARFIPDIVYSYRQGSGKKGASIF